MIGLLEEGSDDCRFGFLKVFGCRSWGATHFLSDVRYSPRSRNVIVTDLDTEL